MATLSTMPYLFGSLRTATDPRSAWLAQKSNDSASNGTEVNLYPNQGSSVNLVSPQGRQRISIPARPIQPQKSSSYVHRYSNLADLKATRDLELWFTLIFQIE